jgi:tetratricopeptide (TPR) repeat protein
MTVTMSACRRSFVAMIATTLVFGSRTAAADDVIYLKQPSGAAMPVTAVIDDFTGKVIQYRVGTSVRQEQTSNVVRIEHKFSEWFERAQKLFDTGNYETAEAEWKQALTAEPKPWIQREIRASLVRTALRQDRWIDAANQFLAIVAEDPGTFHWPTAPLVWTPFTLRDADRITARGWIEGDRPVARLIGASLLLKEPAPLGPAAQRVLEALVRDTSPQVSGLAKAQLWRNRLGPALSDNEIASWRGHINFLPETLRGGPQYLLASAYRQRGQHDRAAAEFLWVPLVYSQHEPTAARASLEAAESLLRAARRDDAIRVLTETAANYPWSQASRDAKSRLAELMAP